MLKIVEVHPSSNPQGEYVVLQNVGLVTLGLRGWAICTDAYVDGCPQEVAAGMYRFQEDVPIKPYMRVVLFTGSGNEGWVPTVDGKRAYCAFWHRTQSVWGRSESVHVLQTAASRRIAPLACEAPAVRAASRLGEFAEQEQTVQGEKQAPPSAAGSAYAVVRSGV